METNPDPDSAGNGDCGEHDVGGIVGRPQPVGACRTAPVVGQPGSPASQKEFRLRYEGVTREGAWEVEHYRMIEIIRDAKGEKIRTRPAGEETHLRYWKGDSS